MSVRKCVIICISGILISCSNGNKATAPIYHPTPEIPDNFRTYDACNFLIHFPDNLMLVQDPITEEVQLSSGEDESLTIWARARELYEFERFYETVDFLTAITDRIDPDADWESFDYQIMDVNGQVLEAMRSDASIAGTRWSVMVVIHPSAFFDDTVEESVLYEIEVEVIETNWVIWENDVDKMLSAFAPIDCGPI